jgi:ABC-type antimicrobial peptide transport system permease subunit
MPAGAARRRYWRQSRQVLTLAAAGLALGIPLALLAGPAVGAFLFGLPPRDPVTLALAAAIMVGVSVAAGLVPARRAARMEALSALRSE